MPNIHIIGEALPDCPLCGKPFEKVQYVRAFYVCRPCAIACRTDDKFIGKWDDFKKDQEDETREYIRCINPDCGEEMNFFCRDDGFIKTLCPKCGTTVSNEEVKEDGGQTRFIDN